MTHDVVREYLEGTPIVMAEDDAEDRMLTEIAFRESKLTNPFFCVEDGTELMKYLHREPPFDDQQEYPMPGIILLDLNMPKMSGRECLEAIKQDERLKKIPVIVLTTSEQEEDIIKSYDLGANAYITKPVDFDKLVQIARSLGNYWLSIVELPREE